jgi:hypothetical protein
MWASVVLNQLWFVKSLLALGAVVLPLNGLHLRFADHFFENAFSVLLAILLQNPQEYAFVFGPRIFHCYQKSVRFKVFVPFLFGIIIDDSLLYICSTELQFEYPCLIALCFIKVSLLPTFILTLGFSGKRNR